MRKGGPGQERVNELLATIFGISPRPDGATRGFAQQLVYLEESCQDILTSIKALESADSDETFDKAYEELQSTLAFVARFADERGLLNAVRNAYSYRQRSR
jgi:hypothetical protein